MGTLCFRSMLSTTSVRSAAPVLGYGWRWHFRLQPRGVLHRNVRWLGWLLPGRHHTAWAGGHAPVLGRQHGWHRRLRRGWCDCCDCEIAVAAAAAAALRLRCCCCCGSFSTRTAHTDSILVGVFMLQSAATRRAAASPAHARSAPSAGQSTTGIRAGAVPAATNTSAAPPPATLASTARAHPAPSYADQMTW